MIYEVGYILNDCGVCSMGDGKAVNDIDMLSISTCWNVGRHSSGKAMVEELKSLGFSRVELNYNVTKEMADEIAEMVEAGEITISSVHNVFPYNEIKEFHTDSLLLGHPDRKSRDEAIEVTFNSVEQAQRFNAKAVVIHAGEVPLSRDYNSLLTQMLAEGHKNTSFYKNLFDEFMREREKNEPKYIELIRQSLEAICEAMGKKGYRTALGLENRMSCHQISLFHDAQILIDALKEYPVYFWFDIGHGMLLENMGMFSSLEEATKLKDKIIGVHIHDTKGTIDHLCPFVHGNGLEAYMELIRGIPIKVVELAEKRNTAGEVKRSRNILAGKLAKI